MCSGSEGLAWVIAALNKLYDAEGCDFTLCYAFFCEFAAEDLGQETAECWVHGRFCLVPSVDLLIVGTSCKDMSRANPEVGLGAVGQ